MADFSQDNSVLLEGMSRETFLFFQEKANFRKRERLVWMAIYTLMTRKNFQKVSPSLAILCQMTNQSQSTVQRALRELSSRGYLKYWPMYKNSGKWGVNYYLCLFPGKTLPEIPTNKKYVHYMPEKDEWNDIFSWHEEFCDMRMNELQTSNQSFHPSSNHYSTKNKQTSNEVDHHSIYQSKFINKHNVQCELFSFSMGEDMYNKQKDEILSSKIRIKQLDIELDEISKAISANIVDRFKVIDVGLAKELLEKASKCGSEKLHLEVKIDYLEKELGKQKQKEEQKMAVHTDENYLANKKGKRPMGTGLVWWIKKQLYKSGVAVNKIAITLNEIVHSVRFGSLSHTKYLIQDEMPIMKSINIALKLVREGKWQSPASFNYGEATYEF